MATTNDNLTAWVGPWGISFAANLTPDVATGLGRWTVEKFIQTMRTGKHLGVGRPLLPANAHLRARGDDRPRFARVVCLLEVAQTDRE
jgi:hypothetical protein